MTKKREFRKYDKTRSTLDLQSMCPVCGKMRLHWHLDNDGCVVSCRECYLERSRTQQILLVGERTCLPRGVSLEASVASSHAEWVERSLQLGAFSAGDMSRLKLLSIGIKLCDITSMNLLPPASFISAEGVGERDPWDARRAQQVAELVALRDVSMVLMCGRRVATAFGCGRWPMLHSGRLAVVGDGVLKSGVRAMLLPHPSGLNHFWNDEVEVNVAKELVEEFLGSITQETGR